MATSTQRLGVQIRPFLLDVSRNLDIADGVLGVAFMPEGPNHVYFAEFVGPSLEGLAAAAEDPDHQFYELPCTNYLSIGFQEAEDKRITLKRSTVLRQNMEPLIREPLVRLFGGRENMPNEIGVFVEPLKSGCSYLYYIPRADQSNEAWDTLCHASFLVAQLLWSTLATAMAVGVVSRTVVRPILVCLPRYFPEYEDQIQQNLEDIERIRRVANVRAYVDIEVRTIPTRSTAGAAQARPDTLSIRVTKEGSVTKEVLRLERQWDDAKSPIERKLFGNPRGEQQSKHALAFLVLRKAILTGDDADRTTWRELLPVFDADRADWVMPQLDVLDGDEQSTIWATDVPDDKGNNKDKKHPWAFHLAGRRAGERKTLHQVKKDARDLVRKRLSDADKWLRTQIGLSTREPFWFIENRDEAYQLQILTECSSPLQTMIARVKSELNGAQSENEISDEQTVIEWLRSTTKLNHTEKWLGYLICALRGGIEDEPPT